MKQCFIYVLWACMVATQYGSVLEHFPWEYEAESQSESQSLEPGLN
jgi:hypothetical protein